MLVGMLGDIIDHILNFLSLLKEHITLHLQLICKYKAHALNLAEHSYLDSILNQKLAN